MNEKDVEFFKFVIYMEKKLNLHVYMNPKRAVESRRTYLTSIFICIQGIDWIFRH